MADAQAIPVRDRGAGDRISRISGDNLAQQFASLLKRGSLKAEHQLPRVQHHVVSGQVFRTLAAAVAQLGVAQPRNQGPGNACGDLVLRIETQRLGSVIGATPQNGAACHLGQLDREAQARSCCANSAGHNVLGAEAAPNITQIDVRTAKFTR